MEETPHPLRSWRETQSPKLTQGELGAMVGVTAGQISLIESRERGCSFKTALRLREVTGIPIEELMRAEAA